MAQALGEQPAETCSLGYVVLLHFFQPAGSKPEVQGKGGLGRLLDYIKFLPCFSVGHDIRMFRLFPTHSLCMSFTLSCFSYAHTPWRLLFSSALLWLL